MYNSYEINLFNIYYFMYFLNTIPKNSLKEDLLRCRISILKLISIKKLNLGEYNDTAE